MPRWLVRLLDLLNRRGKSLAVRVVYWTGKAPDPIHPKHLIDAPWHNWYLEHIRCMDKILDLGCGNGSHLLRAAEACHSIIGVDTDRAQLAIATRTIRERGRALRAVVLRQDLTHGLPWPSGSFDGILCLDVLEHVAPRVAVLRECHRVLTPDGWLALAVPNRETIWRHRLRAAGIFAYSDPDHKTEYTREELVAELAAGGFEPAGPIKPIVYDTPWAGLIDVIGGLSLTIYRRLSVWKRNAALRHPEESTGFRVVARKIPP